jgi:hypothetical protein
MTVPRMNREQDEPDGCRAGSPASHLRKFFSTSLSLALVLAPWPAWAQTARIVPRVSPLRGSAVKLGVTPSLRPLATSLPAPVARPAPRALPGKLPIPGVEVSVQGKTIVLVGTKSSRPFIMREVARVAKHLGLTLVLVDSPEQRANSADFVPDTHFIAADLDKRDYNSRLEIEEAVAAHPIAKNAYAVTSFMSLHAQVTGRLKERLNARGIPGGAVALADVKPRARDLLNTVAGLEVPYREVESTKEAREAFRELSEGGKYKVVMKTSRGENSRFLSLGLDSEEAAARAFSTTQVAIDNYMQRPEAKNTTFSSFPGIMMERQLEKAPGTDETSVEVVMQDGKAAFAIVSDTQGIGPGKKLAGGIMVFPSQQPAAHHAALIKAAEKALNVLGITDGNARLDMITTVDGPKVVEVNPFMGGVAIWQAVKALTGMSLVEQGMRAVLGLKVDPGSDPDGVLHYIFLASRHDGKIESIKGLEDAKAVPGVVEVRPFVSQGDEITAAGENSYEEWAEIMGKGPTWRDAVSSAVEAARKLTLGVRKADGAVAQETGDAFQPTADELAPVVAAKGPAVFSRLVIGYLSTFLLVSSVVESTSLAVGQMTEPVTKGFWGLTALTTLSYGAMTVGSVLGGRWVKKLGIKVSYRTVLLARAAVWTTLAGIFFTTGTVALGALIPLFALDMFFHSIGRVAEHSVQVAWFKDSEAASSRFGSSRDLIEYATVFLGSGMGLVIAMAGFGAVIYPAAALFLAAAAITFRLDLPGASADKVKTPPLSEGFRTIFKDKGIYIPMMGNALVNSFLYMIYYIVGTAFGAYVTGGGPAATGVSGALTAVFGVGAIAGAFASDRIAKAVEKKVGEAPKAEQKQIESRLYAKWAARVLPALSVVLLGSWAFMSKTQIGSFIWPIFPISVALLAIGFAAQIAGNQLDVIMKSNVPKDKKDVTVGAIRAFFYLSMTAGFLLWGSLFTFFGAQTFALFAGFYTLAAVALGLLSLWLRKRA